MWNHLYLPVLCAFLDSNQRHQLLCEDPRALKKRYIGVRRVDLVQIRVATAMPGKAEMKDASSS